MTYPKDNIRQKAWQASGKKQDDEYHPHDRWVDIEVFADTTADTSDFFVCA